MIPASCARFEVLVIDDDDDLRETMREVIEEDGFTVRTAESARVASTCLAEGPLPRLILLDLAMPQMDGLAFAAKLREDPALVAIPIVIVSAVVQGLVQGTIGWAADALTKPFHLDDLLRVVRTHCAPQHASAIQG